MKKRFWIYCLILLFTLALLALKYFIVECVYVNPLVNTSGFSHISKSINLLNKGLDFAVRKCNSDGLDMKILYKNAYGSGFLKENPIPNDLDYSVGVHLGKYKYDGTNAKKIAFEVNNKIFLFQNAYYDYLFRYQKDKFYADTTILNSFLTDGTKRRENIKSFVDSIDKVFEDKDYVYYTKKELYPDKFIDLPFILRSNEILLEDFPPITLYSDKVKYYDSDVNFPREVTIIVDYYVDIENTKLNKQKTIEIVAESFTGQRLQLFRRFFVPNVFIGEESAKFLDNLTYLNDSEEYINYRLLNFNRHLQEIQNLNEFNGKPVKMLKRIHQCADLISPVLSEAEKDDIYSMINENLSNKDVQLLNTYSTALGNLTYFLFSRQVYPEAYDNGDINRIIKVMDDSLNQMKINGNISQESIEKLLIFDKSIKTKLRGIRTPHELYLYYMKLYDDIENNINPIINSMFESLIKYKKEIRVYTELFADIYGKAGFHKIDLYWLDKNTLGILKDDFTKNIKTENLYKMVKDNDLIDVNYKIVDKKDIKLNSIKYSLWVRYNSTPEEDKNFELLKQKLIKDKNNFNIKRRIIFNPKFYF